MNAHEDRPALSEAMAIDHIRQIVLDRGFSAAFDDDCAQGIPQTDLISTDTIVEHRHFERRWDSHYEIGRQAAVANLSDIAASGGRPAWTTRALTLPPTMTLSELDALARGYMTVCADFCVPLIGGNLTCSDGPMVVTVTVGGQTVGSTPIARSGARMGDNIYVSGNLGDAALGVKHPTTETRANRHRWRPHVAEAAYLVQTGAVTSMMDVSDGLLLDLDRLTASSKVQARIRSAAIPSSALYRRYFGDDPRVALCGGEDYVLLFTAGPEFQPPTWATLIGDCRHGAGIFVDDERTEAQGFDHFQTEIVRD
ncbi:MAG: thiamine-phosphate kinase [Myxococcota bacterium]|nr:thiamine-phosphate kinase [Myxococcota bacterium]